MVPEIEIFRTYNFRTLTILVWMRIMGRKKNSVQPNSMKNPQKPSVLKNLRFWRSFSIYKLVDIGNKFSTISSHRQRTGDPKFHHRGNIRCRFRWQWHFSEIRKFYHFSEWSPSSTILSLRISVLGRQLQSEKVFFFLASGVISFLIFVLIMVWIYCSTVHGNK